MARKVKVRRKLSGLTKRSTFWTTAQLSHGCYGDRMVGLDNLKAVRQGRSAPQFVKRSFLMCC